MAAANAIALAISRRRLAAVHGVVDEGAVRIGRMVQVDIPGEVDRDDAASLGDWVGQQLKQAQFPRGRVTVALSREQLGLKRITLPTLDSDELPEMTKLAMMRELPFDASTAVMDFIELERTQNSTVVLAVAVPQPLLQYTRDMVEAAGCSLERVALRTMGLAALVRTMAPPLHGGTLLIDVTDDGVRFTACVDGAVRFSRAAAFPAELGEGDAARSVLTETQRTWMSYRMSNDSVEIEQALLIGDPATSGEIAERVGDVLQVPARVFDYHPLVQDEELALGTAWPLAGLLLENGRSTPTIDFAHPRAAPDLGARRRQRALLWCGAAVVLLAASAMFGTITMKNLAARDETLTAQAVRAKPARLRHKRDQLKLEHLRQWQAVQVNWLDHLQQLVDLAPPPDHLVLDHWSGVIDFGGVRYATRTGWSAPKQIRITVEGAASDRTTADAFRAALVETDLYTTSSSGADTAGGQRLPFPFTYTLRTEQGEPDAGELAGGGGP